MKHILNTQWRLTDCLEINKEIDKSNNYMIQTITIINLTGSTIKDNYKHQSSQFLQENPKKYY